MSQEPPYTALRGGVQLCAVRRRAGDLRCRQSSTGVRIKSPKVLGEGRHGPQRACFLPGIRGREQTVEMIGAKETVETGQFGESGLAPSIPATARCLSTVT